jgi:hypothetical protein
MNKSVNSKYLVFLFLDPCPRPPSFTRYPDESISYWDILAALLLHSQRRRLGYAALPASRRRGFFPFRLLVCHPECCCAASTLIISNQTPLKSICGIFSALRELLPLRCQVAPQRNKQRIWPISSKEHSNGIPPETTLRKKKSFGSYVKD